MRPDLGQFDFAWLADTPWLAMLAGWGTLVVEIGYVFLVWPRRTRQLWALATVGLHVGIALALGLVSFAAVMIVLNVAAFLVSPEPKSVAASRLRSHAPALSSILSKAGYTRGGPV
jgi:hypothetical protein